MRVQLCPCPTARDWFCRVYELVMQQASTGLGSLGLRCENDRQSMPWPNMVSVCFRSYAVNNEKSSYIIWMTLYFWFSSDAVISLVIFLTQKIGNTFWRCRTNWLLLRSGNDREKIDFYFQILFNGRESTKIETTTTNDDGPVDPNLIALSRTRVSIWSLFARVSSARTLANRRSKYG